MLDLLTLKSIRAMIQEKRDNAKTRPEIDLADSMLTRMDSAIAKIPPDQKEHKVELVHTGSREKLYHCHTCGVDHTIYKIYFSRVHLRILRKIFAYCVENKTHIIEKNDIPGLTHTDYGNFYALRRFGFLYWERGLDGKKIKGRHWGVAVSRIYKFIKGTWEVAEYAEKNTATGEGSISTRRITINQIPKYKGFYAENEPYLPAFVSYESDPSKYPEYDSNCDND